MNSYSKRSIAITVAVSFIVSLLFNVFVEWQRYESYVDTYATPAQHSGNFRGLPIDPPTFLEKVALFLHTGEFYDSDDGSNYRRPSGTTTGGLPIDPLTFWDKVEMLFHAAEVESKTEAKKPENAEKRDNESQTL